MRWRAFKLLRIRPVKYGAVAFRMVSYAFLIVNYIFFVLNFARFLNHYHPQETSEPRHVRRHITLVTHTDSSCVSKVEVKTLNIVICSAANLSWAEPSVPTALEVGVDNDCNMCH